MSATEHQGYEVRLRSKRVQRELDKLAEPDFQRVGDKLKSLVNLPRPPGCEKLFDDIFRLRVGDIRVIYMIDENSKRIEVGGIRRRSKKTYSGIENLFK